MQDPPIATGSTNDAPTDHGLVLAMAIPPISTSERLVTPARVLDCMEGVSGTFRLPSLREAGCDGRHRPLRPGRLASTLLGSLAKLLP